MKDLNCQDSGSGDLLSSATSLPISNYNTATTTTVTRSTATATPTSPIGAAATGMPLYIESIEELTRTHLGRVRTLLALLARESYTANCPIEGIELAVLKLRLGQTLLVVIRDENNEDMVSSVEVG